MPTWRRSSRRAPRWAAPRNRCSSTRPCAATNSFIGRTSPVERIDDVDGVAGEVDEHLLAGGMALPHGRRAAAASRRRNARRTTVADTRPDARPDTPATRAPGSRPLRRSSLSTPPSPVRARAPAASGAAPAETEPLQRRVVDARPATASSSGRHAGALQVVVHGPVAEPQRAPRSRARSTRSRTSVAGIADASASTISRSASDPSLLDEGP